VTPAAIYAGTVSDAGVLSNALFATYFNYGEVSSYGIDLGVNYYMTGNISLAVKYSWFGSDITDDNIKNDANKDGYVSLEERSLNAPKNRIASTLSFQNLLDGKMFANVSARWVQQFDLYSGSQIGTAAGEGKRGVVYAGKNRITGADRNIFKNFNHGAIGGFTTIDLSAGYRFNEMVSLGASVGNLFNTTQREFVGSPSIGRLFSFELKARIPPSKK
jgi:iron complex outermembrane receptor protein